MTAEGQTRYRQRQTLLVDEPTTDLPIVRATASLVHKGAPEE